MCVEADVMGPIINDRQWEEGGGRREEGGGRREEEWVGPARYMYP